MGSQGRGTNQMAIVSLVAGVASWTVMPLLASIVAIVCGHMARSEIRKTGEDGAPLALFGLVLGYLHLVAVCLVSCVLVAVYGGMIAYFIEAGPPAH